MDRKHRQGEPKPQDDRPTKPERADEAPREDLDAAPPGSSVINSSRSGQMVSRNPVLDLDRDAGDVLADAVREAHDEEGPTPRRAEGER